eukprot:1282353-Pyramimonas_sp.AAC.1
MSHRVSWGARSAKASGSAHSEPGSRGPFPPSTASLDRPQLCVRDALSMSSEHSDSLSPQRIRRAQDEQRPLRKSEEVETPTKTRPIQINAR